MTGGSTFNAQSPADSKSLAARPRLCRTSNKQRHALSLALIPLRYGFDDRRIRMKVNRLAPVVSFGHVRDARCRP